MSLSRIPEYRRVVLGSVSALILGLVACQGDRFSSMQDDSRRKSAGGAGGAAEELVVDCIEGEVACEGSCIDPKVSQNFCGAFGDCLSVQSGRRCDDDDRCEEGTCIQDCADGLVGCGGECVDPRSNEDHCGASFSCLGEFKGAVCKANQLCVVGECRTWGVERILTEGEMRDLTIFDASGADSGEIALLGRETIAPFLRIWDPESNEWEVRNHPATAGFSAAVEHSREGDLHLAWTTVLPDGAPMPLFASSLATGASSWGETETILSAASGDVVHISLASGPGEAMSLSAVYDGGALPGPYDSVGAVSSSEKWEMALALANSSDDSVGLFADDFRAMAVWRDESRALAAVVGETSQPDSTTIVSDELLVGVPHLGSLEGGGFVATWAQGALGARQIWARQFSHETESWEDSFLLLGGDVVSPVFAQTSGDRVVVFATSVSEKGIAMAEWDPSAPSEPTKALFHEGFVDLDGSLSLAKMGSTGLVVAWIQAGDVYASVIERGDVGLSPPVRLNSTGSVEEMRIVSHGNRVSVIWRQERFVFDSIRHRVFE